MKVKLLKKIRKRFSIEHFPEGVRIGDTFCNYNVFRLTDNDKPYFDKYCEDFEDEFLEELLFWLFCCLETIRKFSLRLSNLLLLIWSIIAFPL